MGELDPGALAGTAAPRHCDVCAALLPGATPHFVVDIAVYAPAGDVVIDEAELHRDHEAELRSLAERLQTLDPEEAQDDVHRAFRFTLCKPCQRAYLASPLAPRWPERARH